jgi:threonine dehydrogenase-like Zn-dependent dehydrogenase
MRGGESIHCVVNGAAGQELRFRNARPPAGERIAVIGAGPAGLTFASLVANGNKVTIFERDTRAGGAFRYAGKAPLFQDVVANQQSLDRYVDALVDICERAGAIIHYSFDVVRMPEVLVPFDRIVIATGATYRFGFGRLPYALLDLGAGRWPGLRQAFMRPALRDWFYTKARTATGSEVARLARPGQKVVVIGDAAAAGKSRAAILSAFEAAFSSAASNVTESRHARP